MYKGYELKITLGEGFVYLKFTDTENSKNNFTRPVTMYEFERMDGGERLQFCIDAAKEHINLIANVILTENKFNNINL